jgi:hypothetical protein
MPVAASAGSQQDCLLQQAKELVTVGQAGILPDPEHWGHDRSPVPLQPAVHLIMAGGETL